MNEMNNPESPVDLSFYLERARRMKWYIILPLVAGVLISLGVYKYIPKVYKATTLILVQAQTVPENYVRPTVTATVLDRLNTISQEILNRTTLERVIKEFNLYAKLRKDVPMETVVEKMTKSIEVNMTKGLDPSRRDKGQNAFTISYEGEDPKTVMMVTNRLASLFIEQNLKVREMQAEGTSDFLGKELKRIEEGLVKKEEEVRKYRERNMGQLPQQLEPNLRTLDSLQLQLKTTGERIRSNEDRSSLIRNQIDQLTRTELPRVAAETAKEQTGTGTAMPPERDPEEILINQWAALKTELEAAQSKYTDTHPDIVTLKRKVEKLEPRAKELMAKRDADAETRRKVLREAALFKPGDPVTPLPVRDPVTERLRIQYNEQYNAVVLETKRLREEEVKLKQQIGAYQKRIEDTPKREQELMLMTRDYDLLKLNYQSLLDKRMQSQMAENLERRQQGEQFKILDPARIPEKPIKPDFNRILLMGTFLGLASGLGLAWMRSSMDKSFYTVRETEEYLKLPVLAEIADLNFERKLLARGNDSR